MFKAQRMQIIKDMVLEAGHVEVIALSEALNVSEVTIRRDLETLEQEGFIKKTYGGAMYNDGKEAEFDQKSVQSDDDSIIQSIADIAIAMIEDGESIFLGGGVISRKIAAALKHSRKLYVITNDIYVASILADCPTIKTTVTGGDLNSFSGLLLGSMTFKMMEHIYFNKAFIEIVGVHMAFGYTMSSYDEAEIAKTLLTIANESIAIVSSNHFERGSVVKLGDLTMFNKVVSDVEVPTPYKEYYFNNNVKLYTSYGIT